MFGFLFLDFFFRNFFCGVFLSFLVNNLVGYYQSSEGQASCLECESGRMQNEVAQDSCIECATNFYQSEKNASLCHACPSGFTSSSRSAQCYKCSAGKAQTPCQDCNAGMFRSTQDLPTDCLECPAGWAQFVNGQGACLPCIPGKYAEAGSILCTGCTSGFFRGATQDAGLPCVVCPAGWIQQANESSRCNECSPGKYQGSEGERICNDCLVDQVAKEPGGIACLDCPLGYFTNQRKSSTTCSDCPAGTAGLGCRICQAGKYRGTSDDLSKCLDCNAGFFAFSSGAPFCLDCDAGMILLVLLVLFDFIDRLVWVLLIWEDSIVSDSVLIAQRETFIFFLFEFRSIHG